MSHGGAEVSVRACLLIVQQKAAVRDNEALAQEKEALLREKHQLLLDAAMHKQVCGPLRYLASWVGPTSFWSSRVTRHPRALP